MASLILPLDTWSSLSNILASFRLHLWPVSSRCLPTAVFGWVNIWSSYNWCHVIQKCHVTPTATSYHPLTKAERFCRKFGNFFHHNFDYVHRMSHQKLCSQSPKTFTPKNNESFVFPNSWISDNVSYLSIIWGVRTCLLCLLQPPDIQKQPRR